MGPANGARDRIGLLMKYLLFLLILLIMKMESSIACSLLLRWSKQAKTVVLKTIASMIAVTFRKPLWVPSQIRVCCVLYLCPSLGHSCILSLRSIVTDESVHASQQSPYDAEYVLKLGFNECFVCPPSESSTRNCHCFAGYHIFHLYDIQSEMFDHDGNQRNLTIVPYT